MLKAYTINILSEKDSATVTDADSKTFQITCNGDTVVYSSEEIKAVIIKTMDTGPSVEDMYAEIHVNDTIYIVLSELPQYNDFITGALYSIVPLNLALSIEASFYHFNKTFVLYQKNDVAVETEDSEEKRIAILEASIKALRATEDSSRLSGFIFAMMSFCPMYLLFGMGEYKGQLVNLAAINENLVPIFTTLDRCPNGNQYEKLRLPAEQYVKMLVSGNNDAMVNFNSDCQIKISFQQLKDILLPLIILRNDPALQKKSPDNTINFNLIPKISEPTATSVAKPEEKRKGFFSKLFGK